MARPKGLEAPGFGHSELRMARPKGLEAPGFGHSELGMAPEIYYSLMGLLFCVYGLIASFRRIQPKPKMFDIFFTHRMNLLLKYRNNS